MKTWHLQVFLLLLLPTVLSAGGVQAMNSLVDRKHAVAQPEPARETEDSRPLNPAIRDIY